MKRYLCVVALLYVLVFVSSDWGQGQSQDAQRPSPPAKASCTFVDGKTIAIDYSSPRMRQRRIFGELVPFDQVWRAGANEATSFSTNVNLDVAGTTVPAGKYTLFTLPNPNKWQLIISKKTGEWGIPYPGGDSDFTRVPMRVGKLPAPLENFTISFERMDKVCQMRLEWETTRASVDFSENGSREK